MCNNHNQAKGLRELIKLSTKEKCFDLLSNSDDLSVADQGEPAPPPLFLDQTEARRAEKKN